MIERVYECVSMSSGIGCLRNVVKKIVMMMVMSIARMRKNVYLKDKRKGWIIKCNKSGEND